MKQVVKQGYRLVFLEIACYTPNGSEVAMPLHRPNIMTLG